MAQIRRHARLALGIFVAGAAGTTALIGPAQAASASSGVNWDAIAQCESGGNWRTHTNNGYSGGLQFSHSTWAAYGGTKYASSAHKASRSQQIAVAERVRQGQGIGAWPTCGARSGSSKQYKAKHAKSTHARTTSTHYKTRSSYTSNSRSARTQREESSYRRTVSHRTESQRATKTQRSTRVYAVRNLPSVKPDGRWYVVRHGDTLSKIAAAKSVKGGWQALYQINQAKLGNGPDLIMPGQRLAL